jgi:heme-binding NEAT domain protein
MTKPSRVEIRNKAKPNNSSLVPVKDSKDNRVNQANQARAANTNSRESSRI